MYVYINCFNISLIDSKGGDAWVRAGIAPDLKSRNLKIVESGILEASLLYAGAFLRAKSLFGSLKIVKPYKKEEKALSLSKWAGYIVTYKAFRIIIERPT